MPTFEESKPAIEAKLQEVVAEYQQSFASATTVEELSSAMSSILSEEGGLLQALRMMREIAPPQDQECSALVSAFRDGLDTAYQERLSQVQ
jgi:hypothetical protein